MFFLIFALSFLMMFSGQYFLLQSVRLRFLRHLPWLWVVCIAGLAVAVLLEGNGSADGLQILFSSGLCVYAAICAAGIGLAHLVNKSHKR